MFKPNEVSDMTIAAIAKRCLDTIISIRNYKVS